MPAIPQEETFDSTKALLLNEGYDFVRNRCRRYGTDIFTARILLRKAYCAMGREAAEQFYRPGRFTRRGALPLFSLTLIQDLESVMVLDKETHRRRKAMFLEMMTPEAMRRIGELTERRWLEHARKWQGRRHVVLFEEAHIPLTAAIAEWAGLQIPGHEILLRAREFQAMVAGTGSIGPSNARGHWMRWFTEAWARQVIRKVRRGEVRVKAGSAVDRIAGFRDADDKLLPVSAAAVELLNILRPSVAIARYAVFIAMALEAHPEWRERLRAGNASRNGEMDAFVDEVRRFYPFIPVIGGRVLEAFDWRGHRFERGEWMLFDLYGTNHDERIWGDPEQFRPERFHDRDFGPYDLVSHGAGDRALTHRCPGEWMTVEQMKAISRGLVRGMEYKVPRQDLRLDLSRIPALPKSRFVMSGVRVTRPASVEMLRAS